MSACAVHKTHAKATSHVAEPAKRPARHFGLRTRIALIATATLSIVLGGGVPLAASAVAPTVSAPVAVAQQLAVELGALTVELDAEFGALAQQLTAELAASNGTRLPFTTGEQAASQWIADQLVEAGFAAEAVTVQEFSHSLLTDPQAFTLSNLGWDVSADAINTSQNVFVRVPGTDPAAGTIVLGANYDTFSLPGFRNDPASGTNVALLLETAHLLADAALPETTYLVFFGADVIGRAGAHYFFNQLPLASQSDIRLVVNVDLIGAADNLFFTADVCDGGERCADQSAAFGARLSEIAEGIDTEIVLFKEENFDLADLPTCACCVFGTPEAVVNVPVASFFAFDFAGNGLPDEATTTAQNDRALAAYQELLLAFLRADRTFN